MHVLTVEYTDKRTIFLNKYVPTERWDKRTNSYYCIIAVIKDTIA